MSFDISKKRAADTADIKLKNADGSIMTDDGGKALTVTVYGPASPQWAAANADLNRKRAKKLQDGGGKIAAALDDAVAEQITFLCAVTVGFSEEITHPEAKNRADLPRVIYADEKLGFIRDQVFNDANTWEAFTGGSATA